MLDPRSPSPGQLRPHGCPRSGEARGTRPHAALTLLCPLQTDRALWTVQLQRKLPEQEVRGAVPAEPTAVQADAALRLRAESGQRLPALLYPHPGRQQVRRPRHTHPRGAAAPGENRLGESDCRAGRGAWGRRAWVRPGWCGPVGRTPHVGALGSGGGGGWVPRPAPLLPFRTEPSTWPWPRLVCRHTCGPHGNFAKISVSCQHLNVEELPTLATRVFLASRRAADGTIGSQEGPAFPPGQYRLELREPLTSEGDVLRPFPCICTSPHSGDSLSLRPCSPNSGCRREVCESVWTRLNGQTAGLTWDDR